MTSDLMGMCLDPTHTLQGNKNDSPVGAKRGDAVGKGDRGAVDRQVYKEAMAMRSVLVFGKAEAVTCCY